MYHVDFYLWVVELIKSGFPTTPKENAELTLRDLHFIPCMRSIQYQTHCLTAKKQKNGNEILASNVCRTLPKHSWHSHSSLLQNQAQPAYPKHVARSLCSTAIGVTKRRRCLAWLRPVEEVEISVNIYIYMYICINIYIYIYIIYMYVHKVFLFNVSLRASLAVHHPNHVLFK